MTDGATVSDQIAQSVLSLGTDHVFTLPSGNIDPLIRRFSASGLQLVITTNELAAGFMADGYARVKHAPGVTLAGGGIASLYLLPAIANARIEGVPVLAITGGPPKSLAGGFPFQNSGPEGTNDASIYRQTLGNSFEIARDQASTPWPNILRHLRAGQPAHLAIPFDVQTKATARADAPTLANGLSDDDSKIIDQIAQRLLSAKRPLIVFGPRIALIKGAKPLATLLSLRHARFTTSIGALGHIHHETPRYLGPFGLGGTQNANRAIIDPNCDFIVMIGARPGQRDGVSWPDRLTQTPDLLARIDAFGMAKLGAPAFADITPDAFPEGVSRLARAVADAASCPPADMRPGPRREDKDTPDFLETCIASTQARFGDRLMAFADSGLHRRATIRAWKSTGRGDLHMAAEQAPMGWAVAASIGASIARRDIVTLCITGDGCMRLLGQELATAARYDTRTIFLIANNGGFGSVVARAQNSAEAKAFGLQSRVDWATFATTLGVTGAPAHDKASFDHALGAAVRTNGPFVIDLHLTAPRHQGPARADEIFIGAQHAD